MNVQKVHDEDDCGQPTIAEEQDAYELMDELAEEDAEYEKDTTLAIYAGVVGIAIMAWYLYT